MDAEQRATGVTAAPQPPRGRVLVVDDERGTRELLQSLLEDEGYASVAARDGAEALAIIAAQPPTLILLDLNMPVMSGWELNAHLRALALGIPVVLMSATPTLRAEAVRHGAAAWLAKPFDLEEVLRLVARLSTRR